MVLYLTHCFFEGKKTMKKNSIWDFEHVVDTVHLNLEGSGGRGEGEGKLGWDGMW